MLSLNGLGNFTYNIPKFFHFLEPEITFNPCTSCFLSISGIRDNLTSENCSYSVSRNVELDRKLEVNIMELEDVSY